MSEAKRFLRKCISCGAYKPKEELIKITRVKEKGAVFINPDNSVFGRSCYICKTRDCVNMAFKKMKIAKILKNNVNSDLKEKILTVLET